MRSYEYSYNIFPDPSNTEFKKACQKLENELDGFSKEPILIDVDGSLLQIYKKDSKKIVVYNDYLVGAVYINSDIQLKSFE